MYINSLEYHSNSIVIAPLYFSVYFAHGVQQQYHSILVPEMYVFLISAQDEITTSQVHAFVVNVRVDKELRRVETPACNESTYDYIALGHSVFFWCCFATE